MTADTTSIVLGFVASAEALLGAALVALGAVRWARTRRASGDGTPIARSPLLAIVAGSALILGVVAYPLFLLALSDWIPRWPGVLCLTGVRRIGADARSAAAILPQVVGAVEGVKILLLFAGGAWWLMRLSDASTACRRGLLAVVLGSVCMADAALALTWVGVGKEESPPTAGCCRAVMASASREADFAQRDRRTDERDGLVLTAAFLAVSGILGAVALRLRGGGSPVALTVLAAGGIASLFVALPFLRDVAAPEALGLPLHRCAWCGLHDAPETVLGTGLHLGAVLCAAWAPLACLADPLSAEAIARARGLLALAAFGFLGAAAMGLGIEVAS